MRDYARGKVVEAGQGYKVIVGAAIVDSTAMVQDDSTDDGTFIDATFSFLPGGGLNL